MAKNGDIGIKVNAEGTAEFSRKMKEAADSIKVLDSEQKLAEAQFKATGDAQQYAADKARILKEKMAEQQKAVDAAQAAVDKLKEKGLDPGSKAMQTWNTRLNTAKTRLVNMQAELNKNETELGEQQQAVEGVSGAFDDLGETAESIDKKISLEQAIQAVDNMREALGNALTKAKEFAEWLYNSETEAAKWADDLATAASQAGIDPETYQSWMYASQFIDTEVSAIISHREKLTQRLTSSSEEDAKAFNDLGVVTRQSNGDVRDATEVFWDCVDALHRIKDPTERAAMAQHIFGNSWRDMQPLIEAGSRAYKDLAEEGRQVAVVSQENVDKLGALDDSHNRVVAAMNKTERTVQATLAPAFTKLNDSVAAALTRFNEWAESPQGQAALQKLGDAAVSLVDSLTGKDFEGWVDKATGAVEGLTGALDWLKNNGDAVIAVITGMGAAWAGLKLTGDVLRFIQGVEAFKGLLGKGGSTATSAAANAGAAAAATPKEALRNGAKAVGAAALHAAQKAEALALAEMAVESAVLAAKEVKEQGTLLGIGQRDENGAVDIGGLKFGGSMEGTVSLWDALRSTFGPDGEPKRDAMGVPLEELEAAKKKTYDEVQEDLHARWEAFAQGFDQAAAESKANPALAHMQDTGKQIYENIAAAVAEGMDAAEYTKQEYGSAALGELFKSRAAQTAQTADLVSLMGGKKAADEQWQMLYDALEAMLEEMQQEATQGGAQTVENFADAINQNAQDAVDAAGGMADDATQQVEQGTSSMETIGENAAVGLANGINARAQDAINAASALAQAVAATMKSALQIASPSKVMARLGGFVAQGFAQGMEDQISAVERATNRMVETTTRAPVPARPAAAPGREGGGNINAYIVMDKEVVGQLVAPAVDGYIGAQIVTRR